MSIDYTLPSVTEVLQPWSRYGDVPPDILREAMRLGTAIHYHCAKKMENWGEKSCEPIPHLALPPDCAGYVASFESWAVRYVEKLWLIEHRMQSNVHGYHGQLDLLVTLQGDKSKEVTVVDIKTSQTKQHTWPYQFAAYAQLVSENPPADLPPCRVIRTMSLRLKANGADPIADTYDEKITNENFTTFVLALLAYKHLAKG